ncbi:MAG: molybdenum cofactor guanylyltransferase [Candidatus Fermentibacteraceae bacterium]
MRVCQGEFGQRVLQAIQGRALILPGFSLLVLAGGESRRMGVPKHLLPFQGVTILDHILKRLDGLFDEVLLAGRTPGLYPAGVVPVMDVKPVRCPLVGILSGLLAARNPYLFVIGCDMPLIETSLVKMLCSTENGSADVIVPMVRGFYEPLCAVYSRACADRIEDFIDAGNTKTTGFYPLVTVREVSEESVRACDPQLNSFVNLNTPGEFRQHCRAMPGSKG